MLIKKKNFIRDEKFRRFIASMSCMRCGVAGASQAAHFEKGGIGIKGNDSTCRPLCAENYGGIGCHKKLDLHLDKFWTEEKIQEAIDMPVYEKWKEGNIEEAIMLMGGFNDN